MVGLPGSAFPITRDGKIDYKGAMSLSTPVAYGLAGNTFVIGGMSLSRDLAPRFPQTGHADFLGQANGTGQILYGIDLGKAGKLTPAVLFLSGRADTAFNFQYTAPPLGNDLPVTLAAGVLDLRGNGGSSGDKQPGENDSSTSLYAVATYTADRWDAHVSLGVGTHRYHGVFANGSISLTENVKGYVEYDAFNVNAGIGWVIPFGAHYERTPNMTVQVGVVRGKYLSTSLNFSF